MLWSFIGREAGYIADTACFLDSDAVAHGFFQSVAINGCDVFLTEFLSWVRVVAQQVTGVLDVFNGTQSCCFSCNRNG